jgi:DNA polymerase-3 subunit alpha
VVQRQERRTRSGGRLGIVTLSDPTAQFEATVYQERLADWRDLWSPVSRCLCSSAPNSSDTEEVRARIQNLDPWRRGGEAQPRDPIFVDKPSRSTACQSSGCRRGDGSVVVC